MLGAKGGTAVIKCTFLDNGNVAAPGLRHVVVDVLVLKDDKILLVKRSSKLTQGGKWALPGGYLDRGDTLLSGMAREVLEETGWEAEAPRLMRIIDLPERPHEDNQNVSMVFVCQGTKKVGEGDWESDEQRWFGLDELPELETIAFDHADNIRLYRELANQPERWPLLG